MAAQKPNPRRRLGRGLDALIGGFGGNPGAGDTASGETFAQDPQTAARVSADDSEAQLVSIDAIRRNPFQPRNDFDEKSLAELTESIRKHGVLQPVTVRRIDDGYQLIMGERRLLASRQAGLTNIPCWIRDFEDRQVAEAALEENLKRKDLNVLEKAQAYQDYVNRFGCTIGELAKRLSMDRSSVSNTLRLLDLPDKLKQLLVEEKITAGHAKALLPLEHAHQLAVCDRILAEKPNRPCGRFSRLTTRTSSRSNQLKRNQSRRNRNARRTSNRSRNSFGTCWV